jgi:hypothetical protein
MDPWFSGEVFNGSWALLAPPDLDTLDLRRVRSVWISHQHPDHFHLPTLQWVRSQVAGPLTAFVRRSANPALRDTMTGLGFDVVEVGSGRAHRVSDDLVLTLLTGGEDSALVIQHRGRVILNQNDCTLGDRTLRWVARRFPSIDVWLYQSSITGAAVNAEDTDGQERHRTSFLGYVAHAHVLLRPHTFVPFASFVRYVRRENAYANEFVVTPAELMRALPDLPIQVPWPGDEIRWEGWEKASQVNGARWGEVYGAAFEPKATPPVDEAELLAAGTGLVRAAPRGAGPAATHVAIAETGRAAVFDFPRQRFWITEHPDADRLAAVMPGDDLRYFCASLYGANVIFGGCVHVVDPVRWGALRAFRSSLEPGSTWGWGRRFRGRLARAESELAGGRLRATRHRLRGHLRQRRSAPRPRSR